MNIKQIVIGMIIACSFTYSVAFASHKIVLGVYNKNLHVYSAKSKKIGEQPNVTDDEIHGTIVLEENSRLVKVHFRGKDMWLRSSQLKLSLPIAPPRPKGVIARSTDSTTPVTSGMGGNSEN